MTETTTITIPMDTATAQLYLQAPAEEQRRMEIMLRLRLRELASQPEQSLKEIMDEIGKRAEERGLTPEILEELMRDES